MSVLSQLLTYPPAEQLILSMVEHTDPNVASAFQAWGTIQAIYKDLATATPATVLTILVRDQSQVATVFGELRPLVETLCPEAKAVLENPIVQQAETLLPKYLSLVTQAQISAV